MQTSSATLSGAVGRGLVGGASAGFVAGFLCLGVAGALSGAGTGSVYVTAILGWYSGSVGLLYGLVAGPIVALCAYPLRGHQGLLIYLAPVWSVLAAGIVVALSALIFHPSIEIGANESAQHVRERLLLFYFVPGGLAALTAPFLPLSFRQWPRSRDEAFSTGLEIVPERHA